MGMQQARWARNATAEACLGPVRWLLGGYSLTGRFYLLFPPGFPLAELFQVLNPALVA
jgi:hypothetical protein